LAACRRVREISTWWRSGHTITAAMSQSLPTNDPSLTRIQARPENTRHIRHAALMRRWPVLAEAWAQKIDAAHQDELVGSGARPASTLR